MKKFWFKVQNYLFFLIISSKDQYRYVDKQTKMKYFKIIDIK